MAVAVAVAVEGVAVAVEVVGAPQMVGVVTPQEATPARTTQPWHKR